jgi:hypothetical protein
MHCSTVIDSWSWLSSAFGQAIFLGHFFPGVPFLSAPWLVNRLLVASA